MFFSDSIDPHPLIYFLDVIAIAWLVAALDFSIFRGDLGRGLGLYPRRLRGLPGILTHPILHGDWDHIRGNTFDLLFVAPATWLLAGDYFNVVTLAAWLGGGFLTWIFGQEGYFVGSSGLNYGYRGFLLMYGILSQDFRALGMLGVVLVLRGFRGRGLFSIGDPGFGWQGHQFGFAGGFLAARYLAGLKQAGVVLDKFPKLPAIDWQTLPNLGTLNF